MTQFKKGDKLILRKGNTVIHGTAVYDSRGQDAIYLTIEGLPSNVSNGFRQSEFEVEVVKPAFEFAQGVLVHRGDHYYLRLEENQWFSSYTGAINSMISDVTFDEDDVVYDPRSK